MGGGVTNRNSEETYWSDGDEQYMPVWTEYTCDICGRSERFDNRSDESWSRRGLWTGWEGSAERYARDVFWREQKGLRPQEALLADFCRECQKHVVARYVHKFLDIALLNRSVKNEGKDIKTTGQLRTMLANAAKGVLNGDLDIERASALHKLAKNITESLYSETKIAMFNNEVGNDVHKMGDLPIGEQE
jgi:hypothetical protein